MDPQIAYDTAADPDADLLDRIEAVLALQEWKAKGGWMPAATDQALQDRAQLSDLAVTIAQLSAFASSVTRTELL